MPPGLSLRARIELSGHLLEVGHAAGPCVNEGGQRRLLARCRRAYRPTRRQHQAALGAREGDVERAHRLGALHLVPVRLRRGKPGGRSLEELELEPLACPDHLRRSGGAPGCASAVQLHQVGVLEAEALGLVDRHDAHRVRPDPLGPRLLFLEPLADPRAQPAQDHVNASRPFRELRGEIAKEATQVRDPVGALCARGLGRLQQHELAQSLDEAIGRVGPEALAQLGERTEGVAQCVLPAGDARNFGDAGRKFLGDLGDDPLELREPFPRGLRQLGHPIGKAARPEGDQRGVRHADGGRPQ